MKINIQVDVFINRRCLFCGSVGDRGHDSFHHPASGTMVTFTPFALSFNCSGAVTDAIEMTCNSHLALIVPVATASCFILF